MVSPWWQLRGASSSSVLVTLRLPQGLCDVPAARAEVAPGALHSPALAAAAARADPAPPPAPAWCCRARAAPRLLRTGPTARAGGSGSLLPEPSARPCARGNARGVGADSGRSGRTRVGRCVPPAGRAPPAPERGCGLRGGARGLGRAPPGWAGRAGGRAGVNHEGVRRCES